MVSAAPSVTDPMAGSESSSALPLPPVAHLSLGRAESGKALLRPSASRSFASLVSPPCVSPRFPPMKLSSRQTGTKDGKPSVSFSADEIAAGAKRFEFSLVAKFAGGRPPISEIQKAFQACWKIVGRATISAIWDPRHVLIILDSEADASAALACPLRKIGPNLFRLFRWTKDYNFRSESKMATAWIKLPGLPLPLYEKCFVDVMVSTFGRLLDVDDRTKACNDLNQLRACIEVDVTKPIPKEIWVNLPNDYGFWQSVVLETRLSYCSGCMKHGHSVEECRKAVINRKKKKIQDHSPKQFCPTVLSVPKDVLGTVQDPKLGSDDHILSENEGWVLVNRRRAARSFVPSLVESTCRESLQGQGSESSSNERSLPSLSGRLEKGAKEKNIVPDSFAPVTVICSGREAVGVVSQSFAPVTVNKGLNSDTAVLGTVEGLKGRTERMVPKEDNSCARSNLIGPGKEQSQRDSSDSDDWSVSDDSQEEERSSVHFVKAFQMTKRREPKKKDAFKSQRRLRKDKLEALKRTYIEALERSKGISCSKMEVKVSDEDMRKLIQSLSV